MNPTIDFNESFLEHHLRFEKTISPYASASKIQRRQIVEHNYLKYLWDAYSGRVTNHDVFIMLNAWMQRCFLQSWQSFHQDYYDNSMPESVLRARLEE